MENTFFHFFRAIVLLSATILVPGGTTSNRTPNDQIDSHRISLAFYDRQNGNYAHWCTGSIISPHWIVTSASCVDYRLWPNKTATLVAIEGSFESGNVPDRSIHRINETIHYPWYYKNEWNETVNDIALLSVVDAFELGGGRKSVRLYDQDEETIAGSRGLVGAWTSGQKPGNSAIVNVTIVSKYACNYALHGALSYNGQICAGYDGNDWDESCDGKTGSPLTVNGRLAGILSWSKSPCDPPDYPSIYAEVGYFRDWIKNSTGV